MLRILLLILLTVPLCSEGLRYGLYAHDLDEEVPITRLQVFGERCSGTKYITTLLTQNFPELAPGLPFGSKHIPPWFILPPEDYCGPRHHYTLEEEDSCLFVVIFRHPLDWLRSMHRSPYHAAAHLRNISIHRLIRLPWEIGPEQPENVRKLDLDPLTGRPFRNILKLRTAKIQNMLLLKNRVSHIYYVNYETVRDYPHQVVEEIADYFDLLTHNSFVPVSYKCSGDPSYGEISQQEISFTASPPYDPAPNLRQKILAELDLALERSIGYPLD